MRRAGLGLLASLIAAAALTAPSGAPAQVPCVPPLCTPEPTPTPTPGPRPTPTPKPKPTPTPAPGDPSAGPPPPPPTDLSGTATLQADAGHTGWVPRTSLIAPLRKRWSRDVSAGRPLSGDGRVYAMADGALRALDPRTGRDLWAVPVDGTLGAYDEGRLFVTSSGFLNAYAAADGHQLWTTEIDSSYSLSTTPVAAGGTVYVSTDSGTSEILALDAASGKVRWHAGGNGTGNTPAVDAERVYASYACGWTYAWDRAGGAKRWNSTSDCSGGGGSTPTVAGGRLYVPENSAVYEAATGRVLGTYPGGTPVIADGIAIYSRDQGGESETRPVMQGVDPASGRLLWSADVPVGSGMYEGVSEAPLAVGSAVYDVRAGVISAHAVRTGQLLWAEKLASRDTSAYASGSAVQLGAAPDLLLVAGGGRLTAFETLFTPGPRGIDVGITRRRPFVGQRIGVAGLLGSELRGRVPAVVVEGDRAPFGRRFRELGRVRSGEDGFFSGSLKPDRNVRLRVRAGGTVTRPVTVWVLPRYAFRFRAVGHRVRIRFRVRGAHDVRLAGRRAYVYLGRMHARRYERLGSARMHRVARGRAAGAVLVRPPRNVGDRTSSRSASPAR